MERHVRQQAGRHTRQTDSDDAFYAAVRTFVCFSYCFLWLAGLLL